MKSKSEISNRKIKAFSLTEILIVMVIIGIIVLLALPNLLPLITRAKSLEAKTQLNHIQILEQSYYFEHSKYTRELSDLGFIQEKLTTEDKNGRANYRIEITNVSNTAFTAKATSVVDFNGNGTFNVWEIDQDKVLKEVTPD